jgi:hypothetical protein
MTANDRKAIKLGVLASAIFTALLFFAQRIAGLIWSLVLTVGGHLHQGYVDRIYRNAAFDDRYFQGNIMIFLLLVLILMIFVVVGGSLLLVTEILGTLSPTADSASPGRLERWVGMLIAVAMIPIFIITPVELSIAKGIATIGASFNQRITVLAPAISDAEYKTFKARWASMKNKADYDALVSAMDNRANQVGVQLPPVRKP